MAWLEIWDVQASFVEEFHFNDHSMETNIQGGTMTISDLQNPGNADSPKILAVNLMAWGFVKWITDHEHDMENVPELRSINGDSNGKGDDDG